MVINRNFLQTRILVKKLLRSGHCRIKANNLNNNVLPSNVI